MTGGPPAEGMKELADQIIAALAARGLAAHLSVSVYGAVNRVGHRGHLHGTRTVVEIDARYERVVGGGKRLKGYEVIVGSHRTRKKRFPPRRAGHDIAAIAFEIERAHAWEVEVEKRRGEARERREAFDLARSEIIHGFALPEGVADRVAEWTSTSDRGIDVHIRGMTPDQARTVIAAALGVKVGEP